MIESAEQLGALLSEHGLTISCAESCTGGLLAGAITAVSGSSEYFPGGVITYSNSAKTSLLSIDQKLIEAKGAVSAEVARAMAVGAATLFSTNVGVGITGIAGPGGGSDFKPVGLVYIAASFGNDLTVDQYDVHSSRFLFDGDRTSVRQQAVQAAIALAAEIVHKHRS